MQWLILIAVCLLGGWWLFSMLLGGSDRATHAVAANPGRGLIGIVFLAVVILVGLVLLGMLAGGR